MRNIFFVLTLLISAAAGAADCKKMLQVYNLWNHKIKGKVEQKTTVFAIVDWDSNSQYDGVILTAAGRGLKDPMLEVSFKSTNGNSSRTKSTNGVEPVEKFPELMEFSGFRPKKFFKFKNAGRYSIRLKDGQKLICSESHRYSPGH